MKRELTFLLILFFFFLLPLKAENKPTYNIISLVQTITPDSGTIKAKNPYKWKDDTAAQYMKPTFENPRCLTCKELPVCMGLCPREHVMGRDYCKHTVSDTTLQTSLRNYLRNIYKPIS